MAKYRPRRFRSKRSTYRRRFYKKFKRNYRGKRKRSKFARNTGIILGRKIGPFPQRLFTTVSFADDFTLTSTAGTTGVRTYRANSLFDPDKTGTGSQPQWFTTLCSSLGPYRSYRVHKAVCNISVTSNGGNAGIVGIVGIHARPSNLAGVGTSTLAQELRESANVRYKQVSSPPLTTGSKPIRVSYSCMIKNILSYKDIQDQQSTKGSWNNNPSETVDFDLFYAQNIPSVNMTAEVRNKITYYVEFFDLYSPLT